VSFRFAAGLILALLVSGCARTTSEIQPDPLSPAVYAMLDCAQLAKLRARLSVQLVYSGFRQDQIAHEDNVRTLGIPSMFGTIFEGSEAWTVAWVKGQLQAVNEVVARQCPQ
jgi:hypothetical protein